MNNIRKILVSLFLIFISNSGILKASERVSILLKLLQQKHISPPSLNHDLELKVFYEFMSNLDDSKIIFTQQQVDSLKLECNGILDTVKNESNSFVKKASEVFTRRIIYTDSLWETFIKEKIILNPKDSLHFYFDRKTPFVKNDKELRERFERRIRFEFLYEVYSLCYDSINKNIVDSIIQNKESEIRTDLIHGHKCALEKLISSKNDFENNIEDELLKAIAVTFDPHSEYFSISQFNSFSASLSTVATSTGLKLISKESKIYVERIIPGSPAWKSNRIHPGDEILKVRSSDAEFSDVSCMDVSEAEELIDNSKNKWTEIGIRGKDGKVATVRLVKEAVKVEENKVNSCILNGEIKAGYVSLPDFYTSQDYYGGGCASDVAKEILKLNKSGMEGLIVDLRFNGGGSLKEAIDLAGIFIDVGPLGMIKSRDSNDKIEVLKDINRGMVFGGKMVVLVNGLSASATELFSGMMQDNHRAVIVGQPTFGKATGQSIFPLNENELNDGYIKITRDKLYRMDGHSYQKQGIIPDVKIPDYFENIFPREEDYNSVLPVDSVSKKISYSFPPPLPIEKLNEKSIERVDVNKTFKKISDTNMKLRTYKAKERTVPADPLKVFELFKSLNYFYENDTVSNNLFTVENNEYDKSLLKTESYMKDFVTTTNDHILHDIQVQESYSILKDLIKFNH